MILELGFKNFFSFKEGAAISFRLGQNVPEAIRKVRKYSTAIGVAGANASGKTNVLRAASFLLRFVHDSFASKPDSELDFDNYFSSDKPSEFYVEFEQNNIGYRYELIATDKEVIKEEIFRTKKKKSRIIVRKGSRITCNAEFNRLKTMKLRRNVSLVSHARQHEFPELQDLYDFFGKTTTNVNFSGLRLDLVSEDAVAEFLKAKGTPTDALDFITKFISECDTGVRDIVIVEKKESTPDEKKYSPLFIHGENGSCPVTIYTESSGTRALFKRLWLYWAVLGLGGVIIADEMDVHLHPHVFEKVLDLFLDTKTNPRGAQVLFTTHNPDVLNILGRYRSYLVVKEENESFLYRLDEIPGDIIRNDRPIAPAYKEGKIGGIPKL